MSSLPDSTVRAGASSSNDRTLPPVVALVGPTGSGKSDIALTAAQTAGAVIVAIDAFTVYRQMTIGTAKPTPAGRQLVPHFMVDVLDVEQDCTVQWFQSEARTAIDTARRSGRPVLLVGGSGLYFRAVVDPLEFPPTDPRVRTRVGAAVATDTAAAYAKLAAVDPDGAGRIDPGNVRRITRALEVAELTGRPFSAFHAAWDDHTSIYPGLRVVGLDVSREELVQRIHHRVGRMLAAGWLGECRALADRTLSTSAAQAIGYAELLAHLDSPRPQDDDALATVHDAIAIRTRQFAARQRRWFARDPRVEWAAPDDAIPRLIAALTGD
jgi:tRNA dimethylallyltransferase